MREGALHVVHCATIGLGHHPPGAIASIDNNFELTSIIDAPVCGAVPGSLTLAAS